MSWGLDKSTGGMFRLSPWPASIASFSVLLDVAVRLLQEDARFRVAEREGPRVTAVTFLPTLTCSTLVVGTTGVVVRAFAPALEKI
jgi:hypothetical protein